MKRTTLAAHRRRWAATALAGLATALPLLTACGGGGISLASPAAFCATLKHQISHPNQLWDGLGSAPDVSGSGTSVPSKDALKALLPLIGLFSRLDQEAPATIKPAMDTIVRYFTGLQAAYHHGATVGQVDQYLRQHPISVRGLTSAEHSLNHFMTATCHIRES